MGCLKRSAATLWIIPAEVVPNDVSRLLGYAERSQMSVLATVFRVFVCLVFLLMCLHARAEDQYVQTSIENYDHGKEIFKIPRRYQPEIHDSFFRIIVDYPSMQPTSGRRVPPIGAKSLDVVVKGYPRNGTLGEDVVKGTYGAGLINRYDGYAVYAKPLGALGPPKAIVFDDADGNYVTVEIMGDWAVRDEIMHGVRPNYLIRFSLSKGLHVDYRSIDALVSKLIAGMYLGRTDSHGLNASSERRSPQS